MDPENKKYQAMVVRDGKILLLGSDSDVAVYRGDSGTVVDLKQQVVLPAFSDSHVHAPGLAYDELFNLNMYDALSAEETIGMIEQFVADNPELGIYYGRGFNASFFNGIESIKGPRKTHLDKICSTKPIILSDFGGNYFWMNSKAFEKYNITPGSSAPEGGVIEVDEETGELWGVLREGARALVPYQSFTEEQNYEAARHFQQVMHSYGYTSVFALRPPGTVEPRMTSFEIFKSLEVKGELRLKVQGARDMSSCEDIDQQLKAMKKAKEEIDTDLIKFTTAKFFIDGVVESATGYLLEPYEEQTGKGVGYRGMSLWPLDKLIHAFRRCLEEGFQVYCHTIGDAAVRIALDALEAAYKEMGISSGEMKNYRNTLTHLQLVSREDIDRMGRLQVIAGVQPYWHFKSPAMWWTLELPLIGIRAEQEYPLGALLRSNVLLVSSSDYPVTPKPNPFHAIQAGVSRNLYNADSYNLDPIIDIDDPKYLLNPEERISVVDMIRSFTVNAAYARYDEANSGSLEPGRDADFIIIDRDPFDANPLELQDIKIEATYFQGEMVYSRC